jgi:uridine kinase
MQELEALVEAAVARRACHPVAKSLLIGISGIDGSGKGHLSGRLSAALTARGWKTAVINVDGWLNLPPIRFDPLRPGENFYENALRLDDLFARLVLPLRESRRARVDMQWVEETATVGRPFTYEFENLDITIVEGILVFKRAYRRQFDLTVWVDCSWETALARAKVRCQEGLSPDETERAYRTFFFPAEVIHFAKDAPRASADVIVPNDPHLTERGAAGA